MEPVTDARIFSNRYELTHLVARGGMAQVYRAHDQLLDRVVALKVLFPELSVDPTFVERFRREAQSAAKLSHPNIVPVFDWGEDGGTYFIVMEFIEGDTLSNLIRESTVIEPARAATIAGGVAEALDYAHRRGVVHRDIKPGNVLLTPDGQVKVTDFGIARALNTEESLTQVGSVMGTATYFSPEQAEGTVVDARSDIYSLGIVLFEMLTGRPPFIGDSPVAVASKHVREVAPLPRVYRSSIPIDLEAVVMMAIAKSPMERYQSAGLLREDLVRFLNGEPVEAPDPEVAHAHEVNATMTMAAINRTQAVPIFQGPRTDLVRKGRNAPANRRSPWLVGFIVVLVLALIGAGIALATSGKSNGPLAVPNVVGLTLTKAKATLTHDGLVVGKVTTQVSDKATNQVLATNPGVGMAVTKGTTVDLTVSDGSLAVQVPLPNVVGKQLPDAEAALTQAGFQVTVNYSTTPSSAAPNSVLSQDPSTATASKGAMITLSVASAPTTATVPTLVGQQASSASSLLAQANLTLGAIAQACSSSYGAGIIVASTPPSGATVAQQTAVSITVSTGFCQVTVPTYKIGVTLWTDYSSLLSTDGLIPSANPALPAGCSTATVTSVNPTPGTSVSVGSTISVGIDVTSCTAPPSGGGGPVKSG